MKQRRLPCSLISLPLPPFMEVFSLLFGWTLVIVIIQMWCNFLFKARKQGKVKEPTAFWSPISDRKKYLTVRDNFSSYLIDSRLLEITEFNFKDYKRARMKTVDYELHYIQNPRLLYLLLQLEKNWRTVCWSGWSSRALGCVFHWHSSGTSMKFSPSSLFPTRMYVYVCNFSLRGRVCLVR